MRVILVLRSVLKVASRLIPWLLFVVTHDREQLTQLLLNEALPLCLQVLLLPLWARVVIIGVDHGIAPEGFLFKKPVVCLIGFLKVVIEIEEALSCVKLFLFTWLLTDAVLLELRNFCQYLFACLFGFLYHREPLFLLQSGWVPGRMNRVLWVVWSSPAWTEVKKELFLIKLPSD